MDPRSKGTFPGCRKQGKGTHCPCKTPDCFKGRAKSGLWPHGTPTRMIFGASGPTFSQGAKREFGAENLGKSLCQQQHVAFLASALHPKPQKRKHRNKKDRIRTTCQKAHHPCSLAQRRRRSDNWPAPREPSIICPVRRRDTGPEPAWKAPWCADPIPGGRAKAGSPGKEQSQGLRKGLLSAAGA